MAEEVRPIDIRKLVVNGKRVILIGYTHGKSLLGKGIPVEHKKAIRNVFHQHRLERRNTLILTEGDSFWVRVILRLRIKPLWRYIGRIFRLEAEESFNLSRQKASGLIRTHGNEEGVSAAFVKKFGPDADNVFLNVLKIRFRDFLQAAVIREATLSSTKLQNIVVLHGRGHTPGVSKFLANSNYFERYRRHLVALAPKARRIVKRKIAKTNRWAKRKFGRKRKR